MHEADEPNAVIDSLYSQFLAGQHDRDVDLLAIDTGPSAIGDEHVAIMEGIVDVPLRFPFGPSETTRVRLSTRFGEI